MHRRHPASASGSAWLGGLALVAVAAAAAACSAPEPPAGPPMDGEVTHVGTPEGRFVGSAACRECHVAETTAWEGGRHRSTLRPWSDNGPLARKPLPAGWRIEADGALEAPGPDGRPVVGRAAYLAGGRHREDLWVRLDDGRLQVAAPSHDVDAEALFEPLAILQGGRTPPPDTVDFWTRPGRSADLTCYGCHATGDTLTVRGADATGFAVPASRWAEPGAGCEACHGPGGRHVDSARKGARPPARMPGTTAAEADASARVAACAGCHSLREPLRSAFSTVPAHRYGEPVWTWAEPRRALADSAEFRQAAFPDLRPATFQQEAAALAQSGCARRGGLTCTHCHDPHSGTVRASAQGDGACLPCHRELVEGAQAHARHPAGSTGAGCLGCHMAPVLRGPGREPARDHSLAPPVAGPGEVPTACTACHLGEGADRRVESERVVRGWTAFPQTGASSRRRHGLTRAFAAKPGSLSANTSLAALAADPGEAWSIRVAALDAMALDRAVGRDPALAPRLRPLLEDANPAVRRAAVRSLPVWGAAQDEAALGRLTLDADPFLALDAIEALGALDSPDYGARLGAAARRPDLAGEYRAQFALGRAALLAEDWPRAETALRRTLELQPFLVPALNDLGIALARQGKTVDAQRVWTWALRANPGFEAARRNLEASRQ